MVSEATMKSALGVADAAFDKAARQAVEGSYKWAGDGEAAVYNPPLYMYGIRAPEDDELPVARQLATQDAYASVRDAAEKIGFAVLESGDWRHVADAILGERKRCLAWCDKTAFLGYARERIADGAQP